MLVVIVLLASSFHAKEGETLYLRTSYRVLSALQKEMLVTLLYMVLRTVQYTVLQYYYSTK